MSVHWILQKGVFDENLEKFKEAIVEQGHHYMMLEEFDKISRMIPWSNPVIGYCSLQNSNKIRNANCYPGVFCNLNKMKCTGYYPYYGKYLLNSDYCMIPFGELNRLRPYLFERFGYNENIFIRPNSGSKPYSGGLLGINESLIHFLGGKTIFPEELCIVSSPKQIRQEWRLVVCGDKVITGSQYHNNGLLETDPLVPTKVLKLAQEIVSTWTPERCFTLDIGKLENGQLGLVEINSFSCSGFYDCNIGEIVKYASIEAQKELDELNGVI